MLTFKQLWVNTISLLSIINVLFFILTHILSLLRPRALCITEQASRKWELIWQLILQSYYFCYPSLHSFLLLPLDLQPQLISSTLKKVALHIINYFLQLQLVLPFPMTGFCEISKSIYKIGPHFIFIVLE